MAGAYTVILSSDDELFGGFNRIDKNCKHLTDPLGFAGRRNFIQVRIINFFNDRNIRNVYFLFSDLYTIKNGISIWKS